MVKPKLLSASFQIEGQLLGLILKRSGKVKSIRLKTANGEQTIKLAKPLRSQVAGLTPGAWIELRGKQKMKPKQGVTTLKATGLQILNSERSTTSSDLKVVSPGGVPAGAKILVCKRSDCIKHGSQALCQALEANLRDRGLTEQVAIQMTGCMKQCKSGPNLMVMPGKKFYRHVSAQDIPALVDLHFSNTTVGCSQ